MSGPRRGLGKGIGELIPGKPSVASATLRAMAIATNESALSPASVPLVGKADEERETPPAALYAELPLDVITPNPRQPREVFDDDALLELIHSVREFGVLQPIVVRPVEGDRYELVMGERRWRASREAGLKVIPAIVRVTEDDKLLLDALLENLHRSELNPLEEALAYEQLLTEFGCTHEELADRIGRSRSHVSNMLRMLRLPVALRGKLAAGTLTMGHARALLGLEDHPEEMAALAERVIPEGMTVRTIEELVFAIRNSKGEGKRRSKRRTRAGGIVAPALNHLADRLKDRFETEVKVVLGEKKGKIVVEFASIDDLERILASMAPGEGQQLAKRLAERDVPAQGGSSDSTVLVP